MITSAEILLEIGLRHEYFEGEEVIDLLQIGPKILNAPAGIHIREMADRVMVYKKAQDKMKLDRPLIFPIWFRDQDFPNYTEIELIRKEGTEELAGQFAKILLFHVLSTDTKVITIEDAQLLPIQPLRFSYSLTQEESKKLEKVSLKTLGGKAVEITASHNPKSLHVSFELSAEGPGAYEAHFHFKGEKTKSYKFFSSDELHFRPAPAALLLDPAFFQLKDEPESKPNLSDHLKEDDLQIVEGIGPKIESILKSMGITSWTLLAAADPNDLRKILVNANPNYRIHNPESWPEQAQLALWGDWKGLIYFQRILHAGRGDIGDGDTPSKVEKKAPRGIDFDFFGNTEDSENRRLSFHFKARSCYWRYFLMGLDIEDWPFIKLAPVEVEGKHITFQKEYKPIDLPNGSQALVLRSAEPIPFRKSPKWKVHMETPQLLEGMDLPLAQAKILKMIEYSAAEKSWCSEIYVNL